MGRNLPSIYTLNYRSRGRSITLGMCILYQNYFYEYFIHTTTNYIKFLIVGGALHLGVVDVETESENWNFLTYGRIGKRP